MMGGTGLLEELLAEQAARTAPQEPDPETPSAADLWASPQRMPLRVSSADRSARMETVIDMPMETDPLALLSVPVDARHPITDLETSVPPCSPLSRQIEELAKEMEDCLGSMENWEDEKRHHRSELLRELEAQYGFAAGNLDLPVDEVHYNLGGDNVDLRIDEVEESDRRELSSGVHFPLRHLREERSSVEALARLREAETAEKQLDEERISQLRAEVEDLRLKAEGPRDWLRAGGTPHPGLVLDTPLTGLDCTLGLQSWREEVDDVLGPSFEDELRYGLSEPDSPNGLAHIEGRLAGVRHHARMLEEAVGSAQACAEDELGQLDQLLSECEELHLHLVSRCPDDVAEPMLLGDSAAH